jgi:hypothetical protein
MIYFANENRWAGQKAKVSSRNTNDAATVSNSEAQGRTASAHLKISWQSAAPEPVAIVNISGHADERGLSRLASTKPAANGSIRLRHSKHRCV